MNLLLNIVIPKTPLGVPTGVVRVGLVNNQWYTRLATKLLDFGF